MATKTSKRAGETSTTVSVGIRIDPKMKFALDIMGRLQKRSLTAVIEWAIATALQREQVSDKQTLSDVIEKIWSTDEPTRLIMMAFYLPQALTYDELRVWEIIKVSPIFWGQNIDGSYNTANFDRLRVKVVRDCWLSIMDHFETHKDKAYVEPMRDMDIVPN